jgi:hypothetical protein
MPLTILYFLSNHNRSRGETEGKKDKKKKVTGQCISRSEDQTVDSESDDEEEEVQVMIDWALGRFPHDPQKWQIRKFAEF